MAVIDQPVSAKPVALLPLSASDTLYVVQGGISKKCTIGDVLNTPRPTVNFSGVRNATRADSLGPILQSTGASPSTLVLPVDTGDPTIDVDLNGTFECYQIGAGQLSIVLANAGVQTILAPNGTRTRLQGSPIVARRFQPNGWLIDGDVTP